jgi:hypothetical protein
MGILSAISRLLGTGSAQKAASVACRIQAARACYTALERDDHEKLPEYRAGRTETQQVLPSYRRLLSYRFGDRAYDNEIPGAIIDTTIRLTIGAHGGRPYFTGDNADELQRRWDKWARRCGHQEDEAWPEMLAIALRAAKTHGDCLALIHPALTGGKLRLWDSDQIVNNADFLGWCAQRGLHAAMSETDYGWRQVEGAVTDPEGRVAGYFVTCLRQQSVASGDFVTYLPADICRRVSTRLKISQYRGESAMLPLEELTHSTTSLIKSEVAAANNFSQLSFLIIRPPGGGDVQSAAIEGAIDPETGMVRDDVAALLPGGSNDPRELIRQTVAAPPEMKQIEGKSAYGSLPYGSEVRELRNSDRPSTSIQAWLDRAADLSGQRLGVQSCLARGRNDASYSAGQLELAISWAKIQEDQAMLERQLIDYAVGVVCPEATEWEVQWPAMIDIDPARTQAAADAAIRGGRETYQQQVGPEWRGRLRAMKQVLDYCAEIGLDPSALSWHGETGAGNARPPAPADDTPPKETSNA